jgi:SAM-dependent methyltransferase
MKCCTPPILYTSHAWIWPLLSPPEDYAEESALYVELLGNLGVEDGGTILHLGSGGGSLDWWLKNEYKVTGVDISPKMVEHARGVNPENQYIVDCMRSVRLGQKFDAVIIHDAIAYMTTEEELQQCFKTAAAHLRPGGAFLCLPEGLIENFQQNFVETQTHKAKGVEVTTIMEHYDPNPLDTTCEVTFFFLVRKNGVTERITDVHTMGLFTLHQFARAAHSAGLATKNIEHQFSDMDHPISLMVGCFDG